MTAGTTHDETGTAVATRNEVVLCGRLSMAATERTLPSGDVIVAIRVVIDRKHGRHRTAAAQRSKQRVDSIDCIAWTARVQRTVRPWQVGDLVFVSGSIRRRFYRTDSGPVSRVEVEVREARRLAAAGSAPT